MVKYDPYHHQGTILLGSEVDNFSEILIKTSNATDIQKIESPRIDDPII